LKEEALDQTMRRARFGRGFRPVVRQTTKWMKSYMYKTFVPKMYSIKFKLKRQSEKVCTIFQLQPTH